MEDFILNEIMDTQEETSMPIADDEYGDGDENLLRADAEDSCTNTEDSYQSQEPYYNFSQEDRNGDGRIDALHVVEDTDGDGVIDRITSYFDDNFDGNIDATIERSDSDGDGYFETKKNRRRH